jgi:hypothetical protein
LAAIKGQQGIGEARKRNSSHGKEAVEQEYPARGMTQGKSSYGNQYKHLGAYERK